MTEYKFSCPSCQQSFVVEGSFNNVPDVNQFCKCGSVGYRVYGATVFTFQPYIADMFPGADVEIGSRGQRDSLLDEHNLTHDSSRYTRKPVFKSAVEEVTLDDVREGISRGLHIPSDTGAEDFIDCESPVEVSKVGAD